MMLVQITTFGIAHRSTGEASRQAVWPCWLPTYPKKFLPLNGFLMRFLRHRRFTGVQSRYDCKSPDVLSQPDTGERA